MALLQQPSYDWKANSWKGFSSLKKAGVEYKVSVRANLFLQVSVDLRLSALYEMLCVPTSAGGEREAKGCYVVTAKEEIIVGPEQILAVAGSISSAKPDPRTDSVFRRGAGPPA